MSPYAETAAEIERATHHDLDTLNEMLGHADGLCHELEERNAEGRKYVQKPHRERLTTLYARVMENPPKPNSKHIEEVQGALDYLYEEVLPLILEWRCARRGREALEAIEAGEVKP